MKKIISLIIACVVMHSIAVQVFADNTEYPSAWAAEQVYAAVNANLVPQSLRGNYTQATTRAEFAALVVALYEAVAGVVGRDVHIAPQFTDTTDINVEKAAYLGIVQGMGDGRFSPDEALTREQAAVMLVRLADVLEIPFTYSLDGLFDDANEISSWAVEAVGQVRTMGIMSGVDSNTFAPRQAYTREQSIVTIMRIFKLAEPVNITEPMPDRTHTVAAGETLQSIAMKFYGSAESAIIERIMEVNDISAHTLFIGQVIIIPEPIEHAAAHGVEFVTEHHSRRIWMNSHQGLNLHTVVRNTDELQSFMENNILGSWFNQFDNLESYISEMTSGFDAAFFEERMLILTYAETSTGAAIAEVTNIRVDDNDVLQVDITTSIPGYEPGMAVTADIGNHFLIISLPNMEVSRLIVTTHWAH